MKTYIIKMIIPKDCKHLSKIELIITCIDFRACFIIAQANQKFFNCDYEICDGEGKPL